MQVFKLPDLGEGLIEAEIVQWHVAPGDEVAADQPLVSVETDKAVVEVPTPRAGRIAKLHAAPGDIVQVSMTWEARQLMERRYKVTLQLLVLAEPFHE